MATKPQTIGPWSIRPTQSTYGTSYDVYPKGERSHWSRKATLYPASDKKQSYVISMDRWPLDARPSLDEAVAVVLNRLNGVEAAHG